VVGVWLWFALHADFEACTCLIRLSYAEYSTGARGWWLGGGWIMVMVGRYLVRVKLAGCESVKLAG